MRTSVISAFRQRCLLLSLLAAALVCVAGLAHAQSAAACAVGAATVSPSCFEGGDGDLTAQPGDTDWASSPPQNPVPDTAASDGTDTQFAGGLKENDPGAWQLTSGSVTPKDDILRAVFAHETLPVLGTDHVFFYAAFQRFGTTGDSNLDIELNRVSGTWDNDGNPATPAIPIRSDGDILITFDGNASSAVVGMCKWYGDRYGETHDPAYGWYTMPGHGSAGSVKIDSNQNCTPVSTLHEAVGLMNGSDLTNTTEIPSFPGTLPAFSFGETAVDITAALATATNPTPCFAFGSGWLHSRASSTVTSQPKDYVSPEGLVPAASCSISVTKTVSTSPTGTFTASNTASTSDTLYYRLAVRNTGTQALTFGASDITDAHCGTPTLATQVKSNGAADADGTFDPGDVWTYTCSETPAAGGFTAGSTFTNNVSVVAHNGTFDTPAALGSASTTFRAHPALSTTPSATSPVVGDTATDSATFSAANAPTGSVTFKLYKLDATHTTCTDTGASANLVGTATGAIGHVGTSYSATSSGIAITAPGHYQWVAGYAGDANNDPFTGACPDTTEDFTASVHGVTITTTPSAAAPTFGDTVTDGASFTSAYQPTGSVTFSLYKLDAAHTTCVDTGAGANLVTTRTGAITHTGSAYSATSGSYTVTDAGHYQWVASYAGDTNNDPFSGACPDTTEDFTVARHAVSISTVASPQSARSGTAISDAATFDTSLNPTGTVTFDLYKLQGPTDTTCDPGELVDHQTGVAISTSGASPTAASAPYTTTISGTYEWVVRYAGDANNLPFDGSCTDSAERVSVDTPGIAIAKTGPATAVAGDAVAFTLTVTNPGDAPLHDVVVTDTRCGSVTGPDIGADATPATLDPGDTWTYTCTMLMPASDLTNTATATGKDPRGDGVGPVSASHTVVSRFVAQSLSAGTATLVQPKACISGAYRFDVSGQGIAKVTFLVDGKQRGVVAAPNRGALYSLKVSPYLALDLKRHTVTAVVQFTQGANTATKTLTVFFKRCACLSRRSFTITLRKQFHETLRSATVYVNGKRTRVLHGARLKAPVHLVGLPAGRFTVRITVVTTSGRTVTGTRMYYTCHTKLKGGIPKV